MPSQRSSKIPCHISDKVEDWSEHYIRESVCRDLETTKHSDGKFYCLLHLPDEGKDEKFTFLLKKRLKEVEDKVAEIKEKYPDHKSLPEKEIRQLTYYFLYVWFPGVDFSTYKFQTEASFGGAVFSRYTNFSKVTFEEAARFDRAVFCGHTYFDHAVFSGHVDFTSAVFSNPVHFREAAFTSDAEFTSAVFSSFAGISEAAFSGKASFAGAAFLREVFFSDAHFVKTVDFERTIFFSSVIFGKAEFLDTSETFFKHTKFCEHTDFSQVGLEGFINFGGNSVERVFLGKTERLKIRDNLRLRLEEIKTQLALRNVELELHDEFIDKGTYDIRKARSDVERMPGEKETPTFDQFQEKLKNREAILDLQNSRLKNPERFSFHTVRLRPNWFVNTDPREMVFTDCRWEDSIERTTPWEWLKYQISRGKNGKRRNHNILAELEQLKERKIPEEKRLLEIACRQLAVNAEENNRYEEASKFRYMAMESKRLEEKSLISRAITWLYKWSSGYGEIWERAAAVLLFIILFFGMMFESPWAVFENPHRKDLFESVAEDEAEERIFAIAEWSNKYVQMNLGEGYAHSLFVSALQRPEPKPANLFTKFLVIMNTILGPLQAALLALAIRRKFMR